MSQQHSTSLNVEFYHACQVGNIRSASKKKGFSNSPKICPSWSWKERSKWWSATESRKMHPDFVEKKATELSFGASLKYSRTFFENSPFFALQARVGTSSGSNKRTSFKECTRKKRSFWGFERKLKSSLHRLNRSWVIESFSRPQRRSFNRHGLYLSVTRHSNMFQRARTKKWQI